MKLWKWKADCVVQCCVISSCMDIRSCFICSKIFRKCCRYIWFILYIVACIYIRLICSHWRRVSRRFRQWILLCVWTRYDLKPNRKPVRSRLKYKAFVLSRCSGNAMDTKAVSPAGGKRSWCFWNEAGRLFFYTTIMKWLFKAKTFNHGISRLCFR